MATKYSKLQLKPYIPRFVDDQSVKINTLLADRYDKALAGENLLEDAYSQMKVADFDGDKELAGELRTRVDGELNSYKARGDYENLGRAVSRSVQNFKTDYKPLMDNYTAWSGYKQDLQGREDLTPAQKSKRISAAKNIYSKTDGLAKNEDTGLWEGFFSGRQWAKGLELTEMAGDIAKDLKTELVASEGFSEDPATGILMKVGTSNEYLTPQMIYDRAMIMLAGRSDVKAYMQDEAYIASSEYTPDMKEAFQGESAVDFDNTVAELMEKGVYEDQTQAEAAVYGQLASQGMLDTALTAAGEVYQVKKFKQTIDALPEYMQYATNSKYAQSRNVISATTIDQDEFVELGLIQAANNESADLAEQTSNTLNLALEEFGNDTGLDQGTAKLVLESYNQLMMSNPEYSTASPEEISGILGVTPQQVYRIQEYAPDINRLINDNAMYKRNQDQAGGYQNELFKVAAANGFNVEDYIQEMWNDPPATWSKDVFGAADSEDFTMRNSDATIGWMGSGMPWNSDELSQMSYDDFRNIVLTGKLQDGLDLEGGGANEGDLGMVNQKLTTGEGIARDIRYRLLEQVNDIVKANPDALSGSVITNADKSSPINKLNVDIKTAFNANKNGYTVRDMYGKDITFADHLVENGVITDYEDIKNYEMQEAWPATGGFVSDNPLMMVKLKHTDGTSITTTMPMQQLQNETYKSAMITALDGESNAINRQRMLQSYGHNMVNVGGSNDFNNSNKLNISTFFNSAFQPNVGIENEVSSTSDRALKVDLPIFNGGASIRVGKRKMQSGQMYYDIKIADHNSGEFYDLGDVNALGPEIVQSLQNLDSRLLSRSYNNEAMIYELVGALNYISEKGIIRR
jgi:hypothetical protein|tara:strand:- start:1089 stop:3665 length:2577 start_codon:yes stop_codon:yes gene_type:complete